MSYIVDLGKRAKAASYEISAMPTDKKNSILLNISEHLVKNTEKILKANQLDIEKAEENGISKVMVDRLRLDESRVKAIADAVVKVTELDDPVGTVIYGTVRPNGLRINKTRVPLGVIGIIFESRPNVTVDAAVLCVKAGNSVILRGGKEAINTNKELCSIMRNALKERSVDENIIQLVEDTSRETANEMMKLSGYLDVLIPRGGAGLIKAVVNNASVPVIETGAGNCHIYIDASADADMAVEIVNNAKTSRPSVCNAAESLLIHKDCAAAILPLIKKRLDEKSVILYGCERACKIIDAQPADEEDYYKEYLDYKMSVKVVDSIDEAVKHINQHSTGHSECIITNDLKNSEKFVNEIDSAAVYVNASTRFTDGGEFGFGSEIGISTQKLHARGPMGINELTSVKYVISGSGQIR